MRFWCIRRIDQFYRGYFCRNEYLHEREYDKRLLRSNSRDPLAKRRNETDVIPFFLLCVIVIYQPERIQGAQYTVKSDVWSLGITLIEIGMGRFPFSNEDDEDEYGYSEEELTLSPVKPMGKERSLAELDARKREKASRAAEKNNGNGNRKGGGAGGVSLGGSSGQMSILELLQHVVNEPAPKLKPEHKFKKDCHIFVDSCLEKDVNRRPTPKELLVSRPPLLINTLSVFLPNLNWT